VTLSRILTVWSSYNESLVRRGEIVLDFDVIDDWEELEAMNDGKKDEPYLYPDPFTQLLGYMSLFPFAIQTDRMCS
jgi:hypothetical protein